LVNGGFPRREVRLILEGVNNFDFIFFSTKLNSIYTLHPLIDALFLISSLKDLLDSGIYTLEQLLCEEELLQDLKGLHPQLVAYLSKPQICRELVSYLTCASDQKSLSEEDDLNLSLRFPYIACEIICCEIPAIVDTLADGYIDDDNTSIFDESSTAGQENISLASNDDSSDLIITSQNSDLETDSKSGRIRLLDALFDLSLVEIKDQSEDGSSEDEELVVDDRLAGYLEKVNFTSKFICCFFILTSS